MTIGQTLNTTLGQDLIYTRISNQLVPVSFSRLAVGLGTGLGTGVLIILITGVLLVAVLWIQHNLKKKYHIRYAIKAVKLYPFVTSSINLIKQHSIV